MRFFARSLASCLALIIFTLSLSAQTNRGSITGTVTDNTGAVIPGAIVTVTNVGTNQSQKVTTSSDGAYTVTLLDPVMYRVTIEARGFKKTIIKDVKVDTAATITANVTLELGEVTNEVTVSAETP